MELLRENPDEQARADELIRRVEAGALASSGDRRRVSLAGRLRLQAVERGALAAITREGHLDAFWKGRLSAYQKDHWASAYGDGVPTIDNLPIFIASTPVDICESPSLTPEASALIERYRTAYPAPPWSHS